MLTTAVEAGWARATLRQSAVRLGTLLPVAVPVALLSLFLAADAPALVAPDSWLALVAGREIVNHGLPSADHLTVFAMGRHWVDQQWLSQILLYALDRWVGLWSVTALSLLAYLSAFATAAAVGCRRAARPWVVVPVFVLAVASSPWAMGTGPQMLALPLFALLLFLIVRDPDARRLSTLWLLPLLCVWGNLHGSVAVGALVAFLFGTQALIRKRTGRRSVALACLLAPLTLFASPYALELPGYYRLMLIDPPFAGQIEMWRQTTPGGLTAVFFLLAAIGVVVVVSSYRALTIAELVVLTVTLAVALDAVRGIIWFALSALALLPPLVPRARLKFASAETLRHVTAAIVTAGLLAGAGAATVWGSTRPLVRYDSRFAPELRSIFDRAPTEDRVFVDARYADWVLWQVPSLRGRVAFDARAEILTRREAIEQQQFTQMRRDWTFATNGYEFVVSDPKHVRALIAAGGWRGIYLRKSVAVAARA